MPLFFTFFFHFIHKEHTRRHERIEMLVFFWSLCLLVPFIEFTGGILMSEQVSEWCSFLALSSLPLLSSYSVWMDGWMDGRTDGGGARTIITHTHTCTRTYVYLYPDTYTLLDV